MEIKALRPPTLSPRVRSRAHEWHNSGVAAAYELVAVLKPQRPEASQRCKMMILQRLALRGATRAPTRSMTTTKTADDAAMRERERCWAAWANADTLHLCIGSVPSGLRLFDGVGEIALTRIHAGTICATRCSRRRSASR